MEKWLISILFFSVAMTLILRMLPENTVKKTVHVSFGIIFLLIVSGPVINLFSRGINIDGVNRFFEQKIEAIDEDSDDKYVDAVIDEYSASVCGIAQERIFDETGLSCDVSVSVCNDINSSLFGSIINVKCGILSSDDSRIQDSDENGILSDIPLVEDIVVTFGSEKDVPHIDTEGVIKVLSDMFGVSHEQCEIYLQEN